MHPRHIDQRLSAALEDTPVVLVNGARQSGKSTLVQAAARSLGGRRSRSERGENRGSSGRADESRVGPWALEAMPGETGFSAIAAGALSAAQTPRLPHDGPIRQYLTLDDATVLSAAKSDPAGFVNALRGPVTIDEVQRAPELFLAIKAAVDRERTPGRFLLTGSADVLLLPGVADSLAGRMEVLSLWPLSSAERRDCPGINRAEILFDGRWSDLSIAPCDRAELSSALLSGGFPEAVARTSEARRHAWFASYVQAVVQRDVRDLARIEQLLEMPHLLQLLALRSASLLNLAELSRTAKLPQSTLKRYFALLEMLFLVVRLPPWERHAAKRLVKAPKVFLLDCGLQSHLVGLTAQSLQALPGLPGGLVETFVLTELLKHLAFSPSRLSLWHYRTQSGIEVDFVLENPRSQIVGIEVKASATVEAKDFKGLRHLQETQAPFFQRGIVLYAGREVVPFGNNLWAVPLSIWWS